MTRSAHLFKGARNPDDWVLMKEQGEDEFIESWNIFVWLNKNAGRDKDGQWPVTQSLDELSSLTPEERESIKMMMEIEKFSK